QFINGDARDFEIELFAGLDEDGNDDVESGVDHEDAARIDFCQLDEFFDANFAIVVRIVEVETDDALEPAQHTGFNRSNAEGKTEGQTARNSELVTFFAIFVEVFDKEPVEQELRVFVAGAEKL